MITPTKFKKAFEAYMAKPDGQHNKLVEDSRRLPGARTGYVEAVETINGQIAALQHALRSSRDNDLVAIAEFGFNGVTGNYSSRLTAALMDIAAGPPDAQTAQKAIGIIAPFRQHIASDERVAVCDEDPFGVAVTIRSTLEPALAALQAALEDAA